MNQNFTVYSKDGCPHCDKIIEVLKLANLKHVVYKLDQHFDKSSFHGQFGEGSPFPQVVVNNDNLGGSMETIKYLQENQII